MPEQRNRLLQERDEPGAVPAGRFRHVATRARWMARFGRYAYLAENLLQTWIPSDPAHDWLLDRRLTGRRVWLAGSEGQAVADGFEVVDRWPTGRWRAGYGDFFATGHGEGSWQLPTAEFLAGLPRDPRLLVARVRADSPGERPGYSGPLIYALDLLRSGFVPFDLREALHEALRLVPGVTVAEEAENVDGRDGWALRLDDGRVRTEILVDRIDGEFIGERRTLTRAGQSGRCKHRSGSDRYVTEHGCHSGHTRRRTP